MLSGMKNFIYRHKKKFIVSGILASSVILATKYFQKKINEWQEQEAREFFERTRREHHFRNTEKTSNQTTCALAKTLRETIMKIIDTESLLLKIKKGDDNKILLWDELKIKVFAQLSSLLYSGLMLVIVLKIQLNVIGGYMFRERIDPQAQDSFSSTFQEHYLSLCHYFLNKGVKDICDIMITHTRIVLGNVSLKQSMTLQDIENIFWSIQSSLSNDPFDPLKNLSKYLLPPFFNNTIYKGIDSTKMKEIIDETFEILGSDEVKSVADTSIKRAFSNVVDNIASSNFSTNSLDVNSSYFGTNNGEKDNHFKNITKISIPLAKIIPLVHGLYKASPEDVAFTAWIHQFLLMDNINMLGANLYDAFTIAS